MNRHNLLNSSLKFWNLLPQSYTKLEKRKKKKRNFKAKENPETFVKVETITNYRGLKD